MKCVVGSFSILSCNFRSFVLEKGLTNTLGLEICEIHIFVF